METWSIVQGYAGRRTLQIRDEFEDPITTYTGSEPLKGTVGPGRSYVPNLTLTPTWKVAAQGTVDVAISAAQSATLDVGQYLVDVGLADGSADFYEGFLAVNFGPGSRPIPPTYGCYLDLLDYAPWIEKLQTDKLAAGFLTQRAMARGWLDQIIVNGYDTGAAGFPSMSNAPPNLWLREQLDRGALVQRQPVREIVAKKAIGFICQGQLSRLEERYKDLGYAFDVQAEQLAITLRAEITLDVFHPNNQDTWPSITVDCGYRSLRG